MEYTYYARRKIERYEDRVNKTSHGDGFDVLAESAT
jgi:hypothetical protein